VSVRARYDAPVTRGPIDWKALGLELGAIRETAPGSWTGRGGTEVGRRAIERLLGGDDVALSAVRACVAGGIEGEVARSVLQVLRSPSAMDECWRIYRTSADDDDRELAIALLRSIADERALPWYDEVFESGDRPLARRWACSGVAQLGYEGRMTDEELQSWFERVALDPDWFVASAASEIRRALREPEGELPREAAIRALLEAEGWCVDEDGLAFLVAHLLRREPTTTIDELATRLRGWCERCESRPTSTDALRATAEKMLATLPEGP
jgi:hypothetical protein